MQADSKHDLEEARYQLQVALSTASGERAFLDEQVEASKAEQLALRAQLAESNQQLDQAQYQLQLSLAESQGERAFLEQRVEELENAMQRYELEAGPEAGGAVVASSEVNVLESSCYLE